MLLFEHISTALCVALQCVDHCIKPLRCPQYGPVKPGRHKQLFPEHVPPFIQRTTQSGR